MHLEAGAGQRADADAIGLLLAGARVIDAALLDQCQSRHQRRLRGVTVVAGALRSDDRAQHAQRDRQRVLLGLLHRTQDVLLGDVRDLVRQHRRHLVLGIGFQHQPGIHGDVTAQSRPGIHVTDVQQEEGEGLLRTLTGGHYPIANTADPVLEQRILHHQTVVAKLAQRLRAVFGLLGRRQRHCRGRADVRQSVFTFAYRGGAAGSQQQGQRHRASHPPDPPRRNPVLCIASSHHPVIMAAARAACVNAKLSRPTLSRPECSARRQRPCRRTAVEFRRGVPILEAGIKPSKAP